MRRNLLASAAILGGFVYAGGAYAQQVTLPAPLPDARAIASGVNPDASSVPQPGSVVVRFGGQVDAMMSAFTDSGQKTPAVATAGTAMAKSATYGFSDLIRLFPTVDGVAANGLRYGAFIEIRTENYIAYGGGNNTSVSAADRNGNQLYLRRDWGYIGLPNIGTLRLGKGDGAGGLFDTGTFQNFDSGGWNGDPPNQLSGNTQPVFPFQGGVGAFYATDKITYLSPQVYGAELGISYEPSTSSNSYQSSTIVNSINTASLDSSSIVGDLHRRRNVINPEVRYRNVFGPLGVALEAGYYKGATVSYDGVATSAIQRYKGWDFGDYGIALTYGGLTFGGHVMEGAFAGQGQEAPQGTRNAFAYIGGASYTVGPIIVGASFFQYNFAGNSGTTPVLIAAKVGQERDRGIAVGGTYTITPGVSLMLTYLYGEKKESNYDLLDSIAGSANNNKTRAQLLGTEFQVKW